MSRILNKREVGVPAGAIYIGRGSKWGNPYKIGDTYNIIKSLDAEWACRLYHSDIEKRSMALPFVKEEIIKELRGKNLACWCGLDETCHADILLEIANQ